MDNKIQEVITKRTNQYGSFSDNANTTQELFKILKEKLDNQDIKNNNHHNCLTEYLHMLCHKLARIVCGTIYYEDSFVDIIGYSQILIDELFKGDKNAQE